MRVWYVETLEPEGGENLKRRVGRWERGIWKTTGMWVDANTRYDGGEESGKGRKESGKKKKRAQRVDQTPVSDLIHCRGGRAAGGADIKVDEHRISTVEKFWGRGRRWWQPYKQREESEFDKMEPLTYCKEFGGSDGRW